MEIRTSSSAKHLSLRPMISCAQCGEALFAPEWSEHIDDRRIRHFWICEACDYKFETLVKLPVSAVALS